jgi:Group II intron, maturase-specific domain
VGRVIAVINPILRGWVNYFRVGNAARCFRFVKEWVEKKVRRHLMRARGRRGFGWKRWSRPKKAIIAVAASMLTATYHMLRDDVDYHDLGPDHFDRRDRAQLARRLIQRLHDSASRSTFARPHDRGHFFVA